MQKFLDLNSFLCYHLKGEVIVVVKKIKINFCGFWSSFNKKDNIFHNILSERYDVEISDKPDYVFCSPLGDSFECLKYDCVRIFFAGEEIVPDFNLYDYALGFDDITFGDRYMRFPLCFFYLDNYKPSAASEDEAINLLKEKDLFCNLIYWEDSIGGYRKDLFDALSAYKPVSAYGRFLNNVGGKGVSYKEKFEILRRSKFTIAVEGCNYKGVTTEKIEQPLTYHSIPIYYGNVDITNDYSAKAFVNCHDFNSIKEVVDYVIELDNNDDMYVKMLCEYPLSRKDQIESYGVRLREFLFNIFDQDLPDCYRRVDSVISRLYNRNLKFARKLLNNKFIDLLNK